MRYNKDILIEDEIDEKVEDSSFYEVRKIDEPFELKKEESINTIEPKFETYSNKKLNKIYEKYNLGEVEPIKNTRQKLSDLDKTIEKQKIYEPTEETLIYKQKKVKPQVEFKLKKRGKVVVAAVCAVLAMLGFLTVYNAIEITNIEKDITVINSQYRTADLSVKSVIDEVNRMTNEDDLADSANESGYGEPTNSAEVELYERQPVPVYNPPSNFFDRLCNFFRNIFGK